MAQTRDKQTGSGLVCPSCGYNLTSLTSPRCPECGRVFVVSVAERDRKKHPMRSLGEFVGHVLKGFRTNPGRKVISREVQEEQRGDVTLRRTTIEEIEVRKGGRT